MIRPVQRLISAGLSGALLVAAVFATREGGFGLWLLVVAALGCWFAAGYGAPDNED